MTKKPLLIFLITSAIIAIILILAGNDDIETAQIMRFSEESTTSQVEQTLNIPVMVFTEEEAESLLSRLEEERISAEKARAAAEAARRMSVYSPSYFRTAGRIWWGSWSWTWYSERILPGHGLRIPGRHTDSLGYVRDGNGYLCLASDVLPKGTVIETPFGSYGRVYDCGCGNSYTVDVYVGW